jgi:hypothetical protein
LIRCRIQDKIRKTLSQRSKRYNETRIGHHFHNVVRIKLAHGGDHTNSQIRIEVGRTNVSELKQENLETYQIDEKSPMKNERRDAYYAM